MNELCVDDSDRTACPPVSTSPAVRLWRLDLVVFLGAMVALSDPGPLVLLFPPSATAPHPSPGLAFLLLTILQGFWLPLFLGLCVAASTARFRRWFFRSARWWIVPAALLAVAVLPRWRMVLLGKSEYRAILNPVILVALGFCLLYNLAPRDSDVDDADWSRGLFWFWLPTFAVGIGTWVCFRQMHDVMWAGPVNPLSVVALGWFLRIVQRMEAFPRPRVVLTVAGAVGVAFLWSHQPLWFRGYEPMPISARLIGWANALPATLELSRSPVVMYAVSPFSRYREFPNILSSPARYSLVEFVSTAVAGGFSLAAVAPFLLAAVLGAGVRRRWVRAVLLVPFLPVAFLLCFCSPSPLVGPPGQILGTTMEGYVPLLVTTGWLVKAVWVAGAMGLLVFLVPRRWFRLSPLPRRFGRAVRWGVLFVGVSGGFSMAAATLLALGAWTTPKDLPTQTPQSLALLHLLNREYSTESRSDDERNQLMVIMGSAPASSISQLSSLASRWAPERAALRRVARFDSAPGSLRIPARKVVPWTVDHVVPLENKLGQQALGRGDLASAIASTSTTLHAMVALEAARPSRSGEHFGAWESTIWGIGDLADALGSTTDSLVRGRYLEPALAAIRVTRDNFLVTGDARCLSINYFLPTYLQEWPDRLVPFVLWQGRGGGMALSSSFPGWAILYQWARVQLEVLLFRQRTGRWPADWAEVERLLGYERADGILEFMDAPFASFVRITPLPGDRARVEWNPSASSRAGPSGPSRSRNPYQVILKGPSPRGEESGP